MDRLTYLEDGKWVLKKDNVTARAHEAEELAQEGVDRLAAYEDAEEQGRMWIFPCKVGDTVYEPRPDRGSLISVYTVISIHVSACSVLIGWNLEHGICSNVNGFEASAFGKKVFLTYAEAEAALEGGKQDGAD